MDHAMLDHHVPFPTVLVLPIVVIPQAVNVPAADLVVVPILPSSGIAPHANNGPGELAH